MQHLNFLTLTLVYLLGTVVSVPQLPVCVVGGGPSGITIGRLLQSSNIPYYLFEAEPRIGGKAYHLNDLDNERMDVGALFINKQQSFISSMVKESGMKLSPFSAASVEFYNQAGNAIRLPVDTADQKAKFIDAVKRYTKLRDSYKLTVGYVKVQADVQVSLAQWTKTNKLEALIPLFMTAVTAQGYGSLNDIPAVYAIRMLDLEGLTSLQDYLSNLQTADQGFANVWIKLADGLNKYTQFNVTGIVRNKSSGDGLSTTLTFENKNIKPVNCSYVVLAFPPYLSKIKSMVTDLDKNEESLLSKIKLNHIYSTAIQNRGEGYKTSAMFHLLSDDAKYPTEPVGDGETTSLFKIGKYYSAYTWTKGNFQGPPPPSTIDKFISEQNKLLSKLDKLRESQSKIQWAKAFPFFPHIQTKDIQQDFFKKFDSIQGSKNIFYVTTAISAETMDASVEMSQYIFKNKILPKFKA